MIGERHLRGRVVAALEDLVKQFRRREELWPIRVPSEPILLEDVVDRALGDDRAGFDWSRALRPRTLLEFRWDDGSCWRAWTLGLPSGLRVYGDTSDAETRILASGGRNEGDASDRAFLQLLAESAGEHFGIEMAGGAPAHLTSAIQDRAFLLDLFVELFEVIGAEESVRRQLAGRQAAGGVREDWDFRHDVEAWLDEALRG